MKPLLVLVILVVATYLLVRALQTRGTMGERPRRRRVEPDVAPRMTAPDDDEDFLRDLDRKRLNPEDPEG